MTFVFSGIRPTEIWIKWSRMSAVDAMFSFPPPWHGVTVVFPGTWFILGTLTWSTKRGVGKKGSLSA